LSGNIHLSRSCPAAKTLYTLITTTQNCTLERTVGVGSVPSDLTDVNGTLFFVADAEPTGRELWRSDSSEAGTVLVKDIVPGPDSSSPDLLTNVNGTLFFRARTNDTGFELWKSDGSAAGTVRVKNMGLGKLGP